MSRVASRDPALAAPLPRPAKARIRIGLVYGMEGCAGATGVTRHALAQIRGLSTHPDVLPRLLSGRVVEPENRAVWDALGNLPRRTAPLRTRDLLRLWRIAPWPTVETWTGPIDWAYSPSEYLLASRRRVAVTSHDVLQDLHFHGPRRRRLLSRVFGRADRVMSVSHFNTTQLLNAFPRLEGRVSYVPNGAEDLFYEEATAEERAAVRADLGLPAGMPYLLSVANFQPRKNLVRLIEAAGRVAEVARGDLALVLLGDGSKEQRASVHDALSHLDSHACAVLPGYREGAALRAAYAEAAALVFPSLCESFGIPVVEAMAQGCPALLAGSTALPEVGGDAAWYFVPESVEAISASIRSVLDDSAERSRRITLGRSIADGFRWSHSTARLVAALSD
jgi:alpha-1,3-rhamnosyl/mannosyltransferase